MANKMQHARKPGQCGTPNTTKKSAYRGGFEKLKTASIDYQTASIDMNAL